jgi:glucuronoarabinoxylan endo-1,4-beta-xylanase
MRLLNLHLFPFLLLAAPSLLAQSVTINWSTTYQTIDGFGGNCSDIGACETLTPAQAQALFDPAAGIGLSIYRDSVPDDGSCSVSCEFLSTQVVRLAAPYGVKFIATAWAPPASMKSNHSVICDTGSGKSHLLRDSYPAFAAYLKSYATQFQSTFGVPLYAISPQNEPDQCSPDPRYGDGASYSGAELTAFIDHNLGPAFAGSGVKIMAPETSYWPKLHGYARRLTSDSATASYVAIIAGHDYILRNCIVFNICDRISALPQKGAVRLWQTETSLYGGNTSFDSSMTSGIAWANVIHQYLAVANVNAWLYWRIFNSRATNNDEALIQADGTISKRFYVLGNWSKFVRPGWVRIAATANPAKGILVTAFKDPTTGAFAIVAVNQNRSPFTMNFSLSAFPSVASLTPAITSPSLNLADQSNVTISNAAFSYSLPSFSVVTFHYAVPPDSSNLSAPPKTFP